MKRAKINLKMDDRLEQARQNLIHEMKQNELVIDFIKSNDLSTKLIDDFPQMFSDWVDEIGECQRCSGLSHCVKPKRGFFYNLYFDSFVQKELVNCEYALKHQKDLKYLNQFIIRDYPDSIMEVNIKKLHLEEESDHYIEVVGEIIDWIENPTNKGFYIYGDVGVGKTFLTAVLANEMALRKKSIAFIHLPTFATRARNLVSDNFEFRKIMNQVRHVDILVMDDIGAETVTDWFRDDVLLSILNFRMEAKKPVFYTSNLSYDELAAHYMYNNKNQYNELAAQRVMERIEVTSRPIELQGDNRRNKLK